MRTDLMIVSLEVDSVTSTWGWKERRLTEFVISSVAVSCVAVCGEDRRSLHSLYMLQSVTFCRTN